MSSVRRRTLRSACVGLVLGAAIVSIPANGADPEPDDAWLFAPTPPDAHPWPLDAGDGRTRIFETRHKGASTGILIYEVRNVGVQKLADGLDYVVVETWTNSKISARKRRFVSREWLRSEPGGVHCARRQEGERIVELSPRQPVLVLPLEVGRGWTWEGRAGSLPCRVRSEVVARERVVVTRGAFEDVWKIDTEVTSEHGDAMKRSLWFAPGVGLVQERSTSTTARRTLQLDAALLTVPGGRAP